MGFSDTRKDVAIIKCDKCGNQINIRDGWVVITDDPQLKTYQGFYHRECINPDIHESADLRMYQLSKYLYQLIDSFGLVEKFEDGEEQRILLKLPYMTSVK